MDCTFSKLEGKVSYCRGKLLQSKNVNPYVFMLKIIREKNREK